MNASLVRIDYQGMPVNFNEDGWFNATVAATHYGKRPVDWLALDSTQEYIETLADFSNCEKSSLLKTRAGRHNGGTWLHPKLAVPFARWLDVRFAIWCDVQIEGLLKGRHPHLDWRRARSQATASFKVMTDVLQMVRQESGKATASRHYVNEVRLVNGVLTGQFSALDRERLSESDLNLLANLEVRNSVLIGRGLPYQDRKLLLSQYVIDMRSASTTLEAAA